MMPDDTRPKWEQDVDAKISALENQVLAMLMIIERLTALLEKPIRT
jgi:hypothetical protein